MGLSSLFIVFRYAITDTYVDIWKPLIRSLLEDEIQSDEKVLVRILDIGKKRKDDLEYFSQFNHVAVNAFVGNVLDARKHIMALTSVGLVLIFLWAGSSMYYLLAEINFFIVPEQVIYGVLPFLLLVGSTVVFIFVSLERRLGWPSFLQ